MNIQTYLAVGELVQAVAHEHGVVGPVAYSVCPAREYEWCDLDDDYAEVTEEDVIDA